jgi:XTP/dITP diphosphohydrolase
VDEKPTLVVATRNRDKLREIQAILYGTEVRVLSMNDFPEFPEVAETGATLAENAIKKAKEIFAATQLPSLADDTGLEVTALNGRPGVYSSRYAGENATYSDNVRKLLKEMKLIPTPDRKAMFRTVMALVNGKHVFTVEGMQCGEILFEPRGNNGFGYDPVFWVAEHNQTFAEMPLELKNRISHRGRALAKIKKILIDNYQEVFL